MNTVHTPPLQLWLVRHGETEWSKLLKHTGRSDIALTGHGRSQAQALKPVLAKQVFDRILCSPLHRARETAQLAGFTPETGIEYDDDLMEWDYGLFEGQTSTELQQRLGSFDIWTTPITAGESLANVADRAGRLLNRLTSSGGRCLLFSHGHLLRILTARWLELAPECGKLFALDPTSLSILGFEHGHTHRAVLAWNMACPTGRE